MFCGPVQSFRDLLHNYLAGQSTQCEVIKNIWPLLIGGQCLPFSSPSAEYLEFGLKNDSSFYSYLTFKSCYDLDRKVQNLS